jgi:hypothetical protein
MSAYELSGGARPVESHDALTEGSSRERRLVHSDAPYRSKRFPGRAKKALIASTAKCSNLTNSKRQKDSQCLRKLRKWNLEENLCFGFAEIDAAKSPN